MSIDTLLNDIKVAISVAIATCSSGLATILEWVPTDIGKLATLVGILLSIVLIITHIRKSRQDNEKHKAEMKILNKKLRE